MPVVECTTHICDGCSSWTDKPCTDVEDGSSTRSAMPDSAPSVDLPRVAVGQRWIHHPPDRMRTDYVVERVWKHRALMFADHGNFTERATVILARMTSDEWTCLDAEQADSVTEAPKRG